MPEKPTVARFFLVAVIALASRAAADGAPSPLDEQDAVRRALSRPALVEELGARVDLARADEIAARRWPNPEATWSHEEVRPDGPAAREDVAVLSQRFDLSGRRGLRGDAAARRVEAAGAEAALLRLDVEAEARRAFAHALASERRVGILRAAVERLEGVAAAVGRRAASGDVAGYDRRRVERERLTALGRLDVEEGALARARARLAALIGATDPSALALTGDLAPTSPPPLATLAERLPSRPDLRALALEARAGELEARAAGRWLIPEVELGGGVKTVEAGAGRDSGFAAAITVPIPLFARGQDERLRGDARARAARGRLSLALDAARADVAGLHAEATRLAGAAGRYRESGAADSAALLRIAEAAYRGGEVGVLELIDGYRAALDADLSLVELEWAARRARIDLDRTSGGAPR
ncbi:TolC family protein [Anaeromyxobacter sp. Fw109-5]|uniref:TolC family protein n=1 Tax=Anaeromyxobacter sp. (strain Fw109-5) TaxID=404589 RepID=UPI0000ED6D4E|nr:TolC family protein [Anaeromyxobacter sp. Fw109-5]ABS28274.1 outer membrane efflux protein [Anaeromyxobacter sp. Fw109-5]